MKILTVDDNQEDLLLLETMLRHIGYEVETASNGAEALEKILENEFDMIISDILMPSMDGFQLCRKVKTNEKLKNIPFIFYTANYISRQDMEFALRLGVEKFIIKPQAPETFIKKVKEVVENYKAGNIQCRHICLKKKLFILNNTMSD